MKKIYSKPDIVFENFSLTTNIAAGCEIQTNTPSQNQCGIDIGGGDTVFIQDICTWPLEQNSDGTINYNGDKMCYHVPIDGNNLFTS